MRIARFILLHIILYFFFSLSANGQHYNFRNFSVRDGLAQSQVYTMLQDSRGYLWFGTRGGGISRYDGVSFLNFTQRDGLPNNTINCLIEDLDKTIWIGTHKGVSRFDGQEFTNYLPLPGLSTEVECMTLDSNGQLWIGTESGVFYMENDSLLHWDNGQEWGFQTIYDLAFDNEGRMWGGTDKGLFCHTNGDFTLFDRSNAFNTNLVTCVEPDLKGNIWVGLYGDGVYKLTPSGLAKVSEIKAEEVFDLLFVPGGNLWIATLENGALLYNPSTDEVNQYSEKEGLASKQVRSLMQDDWGTIWMGTSGGGVSRFSGQQFQYFSTENGLPGHQVYSITEDHACKIWIGIGDQGICRIDTETGIVERDSLITSGKVKALFTDLGGRVWVGSNGDGISIYDQDTVIKLDMGSGLSSNWISSIELHNAKYYIGTLGGGINVLTPLDSTHRSFEVDIFSVSRGVDNRISDLVSDEESRLWFCSLSAGVGVMLDNGDVLQFDESHGLPNTAVRSLAIDEAGWLWLGMAGSGLARMNLNAEVLSFEQFESEIQLASDNIYFLQFDEDQNLWVGSESGIDKISLEADRIPLEVTHFGRQAGIVGVETCSNSSFKSSDGNLWFGTIDGLCRTSPNSQWRNTQAPKTLIQNVNLFYQPLQETHLKTFLGPWGQVNDTLILTYDQNHLSFDFVGLDLLYPEKVAYQWMLEGEELDWSPMSNRTSATYSNLRPGFYTFRVRSCNGDGICNEQEEIIYFNILMPFWQKTWFLIVGILAALLIAISIYFIRVGRIRQEAREKNEKLNLEKSVIELEQKALRLQMNPHFIFNSLNSIQGLIAKEDAKTARLYLSKFSKLMRQTLENSREMMITLADEISALENYLDIEKFTHEDRFEYKIESEVETDDFLIPPLVIQPFAENAIIHGLMPKGKGGQLLIKFAQEGDDLIVEIWDNGIGRKAAAQNKAQRSNYHKSAGLEVTQERLDLLNGAEARSLEITDLQDSVGNALGTMVKIRLNGAIADQGDWGK
ncbi:MAG: ligand-binding sensor domain-containing protein/two-component sensor histidine kinase [Flavobacteriales bacterium]|jgi:ligand-binding sensor domain-containing protein/two-component sensor histidine kinase